RGAGRRVLLSARWRAKGPAGVASKKDAPRPSGAVVERSAHYVLVFTALPASQRRGVGRQCPGPLHSRERAMAGKLLDVTQAAARGRDLLRRARDERPPGAVTARALEPELVGGRAGSAEPG